EGDDVRLLCDVVDGNPVNVTRVKWIKRNSDGTDAVINETSGNVIVWESVDRSLTGNYSCVAENAAGWSNISNSLEIDVKYLPGTATVRQTNGEYAVKGKQLILRCDVESMGKPEAYEYLWEQNGDPLSSERDATLYIDNVNLSVRGNYSCAAVSRVGIGPKGKLSLTLQYFA
ncbi:neuromusculin-like protein, partial [Leptotrombidium deliense]